MLPRRVLLVLICAVIGAQSLPATYNQQQTGELNVQVHVKDMQVLAVLDTELLDDYTDYDYTIVYDYGDLTVKPTKPTTSTTTSSAPSAATTEKTEVATVGSSLENSTLENSESLTANSTAGSLVVSIEDEKTNGTTPSLVTEKPESLSTESSTMKMRTNDKTRKVSENDGEDLTERKGGFSTESLTKRVTRKRCRTGYTPDGKGRCRRSSQRRLSLIPLAMRIGPKLLDDLARSTKNLAQD